MQSFVVLVGSLARGEGDLCSDVDLVWVDGQVDFSSASAALAARGISVDSRFVDLKFWTKDRYSAERAAGTRRAWEIETSSICLMGHTNRHLFGPLANFNYGADICRLIYLMQNSDLFVSGNSASELCDARFLYGIVRELAIAFGGAQPSTRSFRRNAILESPHFAGDTAQHYDALSMLVRRASIGSFDPIGRDKLQVVLAAAKRAAATWREAIETTNGIPGAADAKQWARRASHHRKSAIVAGLIADYFPKTPPLLYGSSDYNWWQSHPLQGEAPGTASRIAKAHSIIWRTLDVSVDVPDPMWKRFVESVLDRIR